MLCLHIVLLFSAKIVQYKICVLTFFLKILQFNIEFLIVQIYLKEETNSWIFLYWIHFIRLGLHVIVSLFFFTCIYTKRCFILVWIYQINCSTCREKLYTFWCIILFSGSLWFYCITMSSNKDLFYKITSKTIQNIFLYYLWYLRKGF